MDQREAEAAPQGRAEAGHTRRVEQLQHGHGLGRRTRPSKWTARPCISGRFRSDRPCRQIYANSSWSLHVTLVTVAAAHGLQAHAGPRQQTQPPPPHARRPTSSSCRRGPRSSTAMLKLAERHEERRRLRPRLRRRTVHRRGRQARRARGRRRHRPGARRRKRNANVKAAGLTRSRDGDPRRHLRSEHQDQRSHGRHAVPAADRSTPSCAPRLKAELAPGHARRLQHVRHDEATPPWPHDATEMVDGYTPIYLWRIPKR